jgi:hypothetical protein
VATTKEPADNFSCSLPICVISFPFFQTTMVELPFLQRCPACSPPLRIPLCPYTRLWDVLWFSTMEVLYYAKFISARHDCPV